MRYFAYATAATMLLLRDACRAIARHIDRLKHALPPAAYAIRGALPLPLLMLASISRFRLFSRHLIFYAATSCRLIAACLMMLFSCCRQRWLSPIPTHAPFA